MYRHVLQHMYYMCTCLLFPYSRPSVHQRSIWTIKRRPHMYVYINTRPDHAIYSSGLERHQWPLQPHFWSSSILLFYGSLVSFVLLIGLHSYEIYKDYALLYVHNIRHTVQIIFHWLTYATYLIFYILRKYDKFLIKWFQLYNRS